MLESSVTLHDTHITDCACHALVSLPTFVVELVVLYPYDAIARQALRLKWLFISE